MAAPYAPQPLSPTSGQALQVGVAHTFRARHQDPDGGNPTTGELLLDFDGTGEAATVGPPTVTGDEVSWTVTITSGTGDWTVQFRTSDGTSFGAWSAPLAFTAAPKPAAPSIVDPTAGAIITTALHDVTLSHPATPDVVQAQVLDTDGTTVLYDTASRPWSTVVPVAFPAESNGRSGIGLRSRVQTAGIWSDWTTVTVDVDYPAVPTPTVTLADIIEGRGTVATAVTVAGLTASVGEDTVDTIGLWRRDYGDAGPGEPIADLVPAAPSHDDWTIAHRRVYQYRAIAASDGGASAASAWAGDIVLISALADTVLVSALGDPVLTGGTA